MKRLFSTIIETEIFIFYLFIKKNFYFAVCYDPAKAFMFVTLPSHWPRSAKTFRQAYVESEGPDQPAHSLSLIRALAVR